ncbi:hypothetical protein DVH24_006512, partial [Malus domestica]
KVDREISQDFFLPRAYLLVHCFAVTAVDSGSKALEFLRLHEQDAWRKEQKSFFVKPMQLSDVNKLRPHMLKGRSSMDMEDQSNVNKREQEQNIMT